jgi:hypothetical protein
MPAPQTPAERLAAFQEELSTASNDAKATEQRRLQIIGAAVVTLLESDADFRAAALPKLKMALTNYPSLNLTRNPTRGPAASR